MRTVTIKNVLNPVSPITVPVVSVENEISGCNDELHLIVVNGNAVLAVTSDTEAEVIEWLYAESKNLPMASVFNILEDDETETGYYIEGGAVTKIEMSDVLEMTNQEAPEGYDASLFYDWNVEINHDKDPSILVIAASYQNLDIWTDQVQHDSTEEGDTAEIDGTTYKVMADGDEFEQWEDDNARDQLVDRIDELEDDILKALLQRNMDELVADFKNMPECEGKDAYTYTYRGMGYNIHTA